ncbi:MAG: RNase adapter RapZ [Lachnospiraceae bacterium]|nr:RNase adapter RapZ [Lachnospiraceae bacterium]
MSLLMLTGMSGSGKSTAFKFLEDMGYYCVDNLPVALLKSFSDLLETNGTIKKVAVGIDIRSGKNLNQLQETLSELDNDGRKCDILFLDAEDSVLVKRYKETRRSHPLSGNDRIQESIEEERKQMEFLKEKADYVIDTSHLLTRELKEEMTRIFMENQLYKSMNVMVLSFGFKYGIPEDADLLFDVRFLPNPYYVLELRPLSGNDKLIRDYVMKYEEATIFLDKIDDMLNFLIPNYIKEGKNSLVIAIGCTGGKHRSVTIANEIYSRLLQHSESFGLKIEHRDIDRDMDKDRKIEK